MLNVMSSIQMPYHHPSLAAFSKSTQPNCELQTELQMSVKHSFEKKSQDHS